MGGSVGRSGGGRKVAQLQQALPLLLPLIALQLLLMILAVIDLFREERRVRWVSKPVWALIVVFINILGPLAYFFFGREE
jgi:hypothetical protein